MKQEVKPSYFPSSGPTEGAWGDGDGLPRSDGRAADDWRQTAKPRRCRWGSRWRGTPPFHRQRGRAVIPEPWTVHFPRLDVLHLCWQTLCLHIIWVISLHFYAADVSPCQQGPWQSKDGEPSSFLKCCTWNSLLSFPSLSPHWLSESHGMPSRVQS